jgi:hypothetical protein
MGQGYLETTVSELRFTKDFSGTLHADFDVYLTATDSEGAKGANIVSCTSDFEKFGFDSLRAGPSGLLDVKLRYAGKKEIAAACAPGAPVPPDVIGGTSEDEAFISSESIKSGYFAVDLNTRKIANLADRSQAMLAPQQEAAVEPEKPASAAPPPISPTPVPLGKRVALVVGNSDYSSIPVLDNPLNDANLMAETLSGLGFELVGRGARTNLDKASFDAAVQKFGNQLQGADVGLFYYAGHGVQVHGSNYLIPISANPTKEADVDFQVVDMSVVLRQMEGSGTRLNLVMLDACRNNPFGGRGLRASGGGLAQMQAPEGTLISFATQPANVAQDGSDNHSPYTRALAEIIKSPGVDILQTFNRVGLEVKRATGGSQQPWLSSSPIEGAFYFKPGS